MTSASGLKPPAETASSLDGEATKAAVPKGQAPTTPAINQGEAEILREACQAVAARYDESWSPMCVERELGDLCRNALAASLSARSTAEGV